jgi:hypothetical protein
MCALDMILEKTLVAQIVSQIGNSFSPLDLYQLGPQSWIPRVYVLINLFQTLFSTGTYTLHINHQSILQKVTKW